MPDRSDHDPAVDSSPDVAPDGSLVDHDEPTREDNRPPWSTRVRRRLRSTALVAGIRTRGWLRNGIRLLALVTVVVAAYNAVFAPIATLPVVAPYLSLTSQLISGYGLGIGQAFLSHVFVFVVAAIVVWKV